MMTEQLRRQAFSSLRRFGIVSAVGISASGALVGAARADLLPPATYLETADFSNSVTKQDVFQCNGVGCGGTETLSGGTQWSVTSGPASTTIVNPFVGPLSITSSSTGQAAISANSSGEVDYFLKLTGPAVFSNGLIPIRVDMTAHVDVSLSDPNDPYAFARAMAGIQVWFPFNQGVSGPQYQQVLASFSVFSPQPDIPTDISAAAGTACTQGQSCVSSADLAKSFLFELKPDVQYLITVFTDTDVQDTERFGTHIGNSSQQANAFVDPHFYLDPNFNNPLDQLLLSPDISNDPPGTAGAVPEPSTWAMLGIGFGLLALLYRRRAAGARLGHAA
jgi:hypothetical protein